MSEKKSRNLHNSSLVSRMYPETCAKPFLKWAVSKTQVLDELYRRLPPGLGEKGKITSFAEPFIGSGAVFFYLS